MCSILLTRVEMTVVNLELGLVLVGDVFPGGQEHLAVCTPQRNTTMLRTKLIPAVRFIRYSLSDLLEIPKPSMSFQ